MMNNDLISRDALKKVIEEKATFIDGDSVYKIIDLINNAPTVFSCNACKNMGNERECVDCHDYSNYVHYDERPQGEWIIKDISLHKYSYTCPLCKTEYVDNYDGYVSVCDFNYCPNCGADMRGEKE